MSPAGGEEVVAEVPGPIGDGETGPLVAIYFFSCNPECVLLMAKVRLWLEHQYRKKLHLEIPSRILKIFSNAI